MQHINTNKGKEAGFTLVELAIVMIIIGLLIGGILKGQELINNARVASTIAQVKGITAATNTFRDQFRAIPGDMPNAQATARLPNCAAAPCTGPGNGDTQVGAPGSASVGPVAGENLTFWAHLNAADMLTGVDGSPTVAWGQALPAADIGGGFVPGFENAAGGTIGGVAGSNGRGGNYIMLRSTPNAAAADGFRTIIPTQAFRMDSKLDDGSPTTGSVFGAGANCQVAAGAGAITYSNVDQQACDVLIRM